MLQLILFCIFHQDNLLIIYTPHQNTIFSLVSVHFQVLRSVWYLINHFLYEWDTCSRLNSGETEKQDCPRRGDNSLVCWRKVYSTCHESFSPGIWLIYPSPTCGPRCFKPLEMICSERPLSAWFTGANWFRVLTKKGIKMSHKRFF